MQSSMRGRDPEVAAWLYKMMNDPEFYERWFYLDAIDDHNSIITHCQQLLEITPASQWHQRAKLEHTLRRARRDLAEVKAEHAEYKAFKDKTAIPK